MKNGAHDRADAVRGIAAQFVLLSHTYFEFTRVADPTLSFLARSSVWVFFFLSGFAIASSIKSETERSGTFDPVDYTLRRVARIYPPYIFATFLCILAGNYPNRAETATWTLAVPYAPVTVRGVSVVLVSKDADEDVPTSRLTSKSSVAPDHVS